LKTISKATPAVVAAAAVDLVEDVAALEADVETAAEEETVAVVTTAAEAGIATMITVAATTVAVVDVARI